MSQELLIIEKFENPAEVYKDGGLEPFLTKIEEFVNTIVADPTTKDGEKTIKSIARDIAKSRKAVDDIGKALGEDYRKAIKDINNERNRGVERLNALHDKFRKPLTDIENAEKMRVSEHESKLQRISDLIDDTKCYISVEERITELSEIMERNFEEFQDSAESRFQLTSKILHDKYEAEQKALQDAKELEELRKLKEEKDRADREEIIKQQAIQQAKKQEEREANKRANDLEHKKKINNEALQALEIIAKNNGFDNIEALKAIITAIIKGEIPHVSIRY